MTTVIVVGAGMAGIIATQTLINAGISVQVLEARDRVGGRTHTDHSLGTSADLGAAWIHGPIGNPLTPLAERFGVAGTLNDLAERKNGTHQAYSADGKPFDMTAFMQGQQAAQAAIINTIGSLQTPELTEQVASQQDLVDACNAMAEPRTPVEQAAFNYTTLIRPSLWDAADPEQIDWTADYLDLPGGDLLLDGGGYNAITDALAADLPIATNQVVQSIQLDDSGVVVTTKDGAYSADAVIVTVPLGVLKAGAIQFEPALPTEKQAAIQRIGFGSAEKLLLLFDNVYWPEHVEQITYYSADGSQYFSSWSTPGRAANVPILAAYLTGAHARATTTWSDEELLDRAMQVLRSMFPTLPDPLRVVRTGWHTDPFARGSYSFAAVGQLEDDRATLGRPIDGKLFFAGEAIHPYYFGTVHGAYETGVFAAKAALSALR